MQSAQTTTMLKRAIVRFEIYNHTQGIAGANLGDITVNCNRSDCKRSNAASKTVFIGKGRVTVYLEKGIHCAPTTKLFDILIWVNSI